MDISWPAVLAVGLAPVVASWALQQANRRSQDGKHFRSVIRSVFPGNLIVFGIGCAFFAKEIVQPGEYQPKSFIAYSGAIVCFFFLVLTIVRWPAAVVIQGEGLNFRRMFHRRRLICWEELDDAVISLDGRLVIYTKNGEQFELSEYTEGREELKELIKRRATQAS